MTYLTNWRTLVSVDLHIIIKVIYLHVWLYKCLVIVCDSAVQLLQCGAELYNDSAVQLLQCDAAFLLLHSVYIVAIQLNKTSKIVTPLCLYPRLCCSYCTIEFVMLKSNVYIPASCTTNLLLPLALQPTVGFGLSNKVLPFSPIYQCQ